MANHPHRRFGRRGNANVTILALMPMLGFGALAVDIGQAQLARTQLSAGVDAAALAGVGYMDGSADGLDRAVDMAIAVGGQNTVLGSPLTLSRSDVTPGHYDAETDAFLETWDPELADALYVRRRFDGVGTVFAGGAFGTHLLSTEARSVARQSAGVGAGAVDCYLPLAIPDCMLDMDGAESMALRLSSSNQDNAGWARIGAHPNAAYVKDQLAGTCEGGVARVGDEVGLNNGVISTGLTALRKEIDDSEVTWDTSRWGPLPAQMDGGGAHSTVNNYGNVIEGPIIVFESPNGACGAQTQFNGYQEIVGFVWAVAYDVDDHGGGKNIRVRLDLTNEYTVGTSGGGLDTNVTHRGSGGLVY